MVALSPTYHHDWQRRRAAEDPAWYEARKQQRTLARRAHKAHWVAHFGGRCKDCKRKYPPAVFEFHHLAEETKAVPNRSTNYVLMLSKKRAAKELRKCVMLCANCHRIRHARSG